MNTNTSQAWIGIDKIKKENYNFKNTIAHHKKIDALTYFFGTFAN
jgi:hypothetical protein